MENMEYGVTADGLRAVVRIDAELDAGQIEELISRLRDCRAAMAPRRFPVMFQSSRIAVGEGVHVQHDPAGLMVSVSHPGLGWIGARIGEKELRALMPRSRSRRPAACGGSSPGAAHRRGAGA